MVLLHYKTIPELVAQVRRLTAATRPASRPAPGAGSASARVMPAGCRRHPRADGAPVRAARAQGRGCRALPPRLRGGPRESTG
jgi:hypothetical protein